MLINKKYKNVKITNKLNKNDIILDIRLKDEQERNPLNIKNIEVKLLPFYKLENYSNKLDPNKSYLLYCNRGIMSRLQAIYLRRKGFYNVKVLKLIP